MANLIQRASQNLRDRRNSEMSVSIVYLPRNLDPIVVLASIGSTKFKIVGLDGIFRIEKSIDFKIDRELLIDFSGEEITPSEGDRLRWDGSEYEVLSYNNEPHWRWTSQYKVTRRIHSKKVNNL